MRSLQDNETMIVCPDKSFAANGKNGSSGSIQNGTHKSADPSVPSSENIFGQMLKQIYETPWIGVPQETVNMLVEISVEDGTLGIVCKVVRESVVTPSVTPEKRGQVFRQIRVGVQHFAAENPLKR